MLNIVKCHRCQHIWGYSGESLTTICPACKTTIRVQKSLIPCKWDYDLTEEQPNPTIIPGMIVPFIEKWGNKFTLKFFLFSSDENPSSYGRILEFVKLRSSLHEARSEFDLRAKSGAVPLSDSLKEKLKKLVSNRDKE